MALRILAVALLTIALAVPGASALDTEAEEARDCGGRVDWDCNHETSPHDHCGLYLDLQGTGDGQCVLY